MKALFVIAEYILSEKIQRILQKNGVPFKFITRGHGTADSEMLDYLGLGDNKKIICIYLANDKDIPHLYRVLERCMALSKAGRGIAFTIPLNGASGLLAKLYETGGEKENTSKSIETKAKEENVKMESYQHELIITIVSRGSFDAVKDAARKAGARGGTLIHGLGIGGEEAAKFFGISIQPEKDIVLIVVKKEEKANIMKSILAETGMITEHRGVCFSLPVDSAFGLAGIDDYEDEDTDV